MWRRAARRRPSWLFLEGGHDRPLVEVGLLGELPQGFSELAIGAVVTRPCENLPVRRGVGYSGEHVIEVAGLKTAWETSWAEWRLVQYGRLYEHQRTPL
jgi:hypothetical protein